MTGYAGGDYGTMTVNGTPVAAIGIDALHGAGYLTLLAGRASRHRARSPSARGRWPPPTSASGRTSGS